MTNPTAPLLSESEVSETEARADRLLSFLTFGHPERGNRYVESLDQNIYFEEDADAEFDAFDLLRHFPALIRDWRALKAESDKQAAFANVNFKEWGKLRDENAALREQLAQANAQIERLNTFGESMLRRLEAVAGIQPSAGHGWEFVVSKLELESQP